MNVAAPQIEKQRTIIVIFAVELMNPFQAYRMPYPEACPKRRK